MGLFSRGLDPGVLVGVSVETGMSVCRNWWMRREGRCCNFEIVWGREMMRGGRRRERRSMVVLESL